MKIRTQRLLLRQWRDEDLPVFAAMNQDPRVMEFFPSVLDRQQSDDLAATIRRLIKQRGWGFWAIESLEIANFIGFAGLHIPRDDLPFSPCTEIGWRLAFEFWGKGYASEAAQAVLELGFKFDSSDFSVGH